MIKNIRAKSFKSVFSLTHSNEIEIKEILRGMNVRKNCQLKDIPTKIMKINGNIFASFIRLHFNCCIDNRGFLQVYKHTDIIPVHTKKERKMIKLTTDLSAYCKTFLKFTKKFTVNCVVILIRYFYRVKWIPQSI